MLPWVVVWEELVAWAVAVFFLASEAVGALRRGSGTGYSGFSVSQQVIYASPVSFFFSVFRVMVSSWCIFSSRISYS